jgi:hypothetical protein
LVKGRAFVANLADSLLVHRHYWAIYDDADRTEGFAVGRSHVTRRCSRPEDAAVDHLLQSLDRKDDVEIASRSDRRLLELMYLEIGHRRI